MTRIKITTFAQLVTFFEQPHITVAEISKILSEAKIVWLINDDPKEIVIEKLKVFWDKWGTAIEKPIFIFYMYI